MPRKGTIWYLPANRVSHRLRDFFRLKWWDWFITFMIVSNIFIMALDHYPQSSAWDRLQVKAPPTPISLSWLTRSC